LVVLPGSFNPIHDGHTELLRAAVELRGDDATGVLELSALNADKGRVADNEMRRRAGLVRATGFPLAVTAAPLFVDKVAIFPPGTAFALGFDTAVRVLDPKYYRSAGDEAGNAGLLAILDTIRARGATIYVAGRAPLGADKLPQPDAGFLTLADIAVPAGYEDLFVAIPTAKFRSDVSSSAIRSQEEKQQRQ
jgi:hypothetical protein